MADFAIIRSGGKQYKVGVGDKVELELLTVPEDNKEVELEVVMTSKGGKVALGKPTLKTTAKGVVLETVKGEKIDVRTFKAKSRYRRHIGHRQKYSLVEIKSI